MTTKRVALPPYHDPPVLMTRADVAELALLRRLFDTSVDIELRDGTWLERHGTKWNVYRNTVCVMSGATIEQAAKYVAGGG